MRTIDTLTGGVEGIIAAEQHQENTALLLIFF